jgi:predicted Zn-dependent protease
MDIPKDSEVGIERYDGSKEDGWEVRVRWNENLLEEEGDRERWAESVGAAVEGWAVYANEVEEDAVSGYEGL